MTIPVGFIGLGNMGNPMALNVLKSGFAVTVYDTNASVMGNLVEAGAKRASSAAEVLANCEVLLTSLPGSPEVEAFYLGAGGAVELAKPGTAFVDHVAGFDQRPSDTAVALGSAQKYGRPPPTALTARAWLWSV